MRRIATLAVAAVLTALAGSAAGCGIGCEDVRAIRAATAPGFSVTETGAADTARVMLSGFLHPTQREVEAFPELFRVLARDAGDGRSLLVTLHGYETPPGDRITLALAIPGRARAGDRYRVAGAFAPPGRPADEWGFRAPAAPGEAEVGFMRSRPRIPTPPYDYAAVYTATAAAGSVQVLGRERGLLSLAMELTVTDDSGRGYRVAGTATVAAAGEGKVCFGPS